MIFIKRNCSNFKRISGILAKHQLSENVGIRVRSILLLNTEYVSVKDFHRLLISILVGLDKEYPTSEESCLPGCK